MTLGLYKNCVVHPNS